MGTIAVHEDSKSPRTNLEDVVLNIQNARIEYSNLDGTMNQILQELKKMNLYLSAMSEREFDNYQVEV